MRNDRSCVNPDDQLEESERVIADFERRVIELEGELIQLRIQCHNDRFGANSKTIVELRCMEGGGEGTE